ncbi:MAG TPA: hypothetical protein PK640_13520, partial [Verrucomicrobiota bacterium]|nr:hypothetical protein [Verrucomicrobiota bacterium]
TVASALSNPFTVWLNAEATVDVLCTAGPPVGDSDGTGYMLHFADVKAGDTIDFHASPTNLALVHFNVANGEGLDSPRVTLWPTFPGVSLPSGGPCFVRDPVVRWHELHLWMTPEPACFGFGAWPDDPSYPYNFNPRVLDLAAGQSYSLNSGGSLAPRVWFSEAEPQKLWVELKSEYGSDICSFIPNDPPGAPLVRMYDQAGNLIESSRLNGTVRTFDYDLHGRRYEIDMDLGFFGHYLLSGACLSPTNTLVMVRQETPHFTLDLPTQFASLASTLTNHAEEAYSTMQMALNSQPGVKLHFFPTLVEAGWAGGATFAAHINFLKDPRAMDYPDDTFKGAFCHEVGHVFQGQSRGLYEFGSPVQAHAEAQASVLRNVAEEGWTGVRAARRVDVEHRENFFMALYRQHGYLEELQRGDCPECFEDYWRYYFIISHLKDIYGPAILQGYAQRWGGWKTRPYLEEFAGGNGLSNEDLVCGLYSLAAGSDLSWLFQAAGFPVLPDKVRLLTDWWATQNRQPSITNITVDAGSVHLAWDVPTNRFIVERSESLNGWWCAATSAGKWDHNVRMPRAPGQQGFFRLQFGLEAVDLPDVQLANALRTQVSYKIEPTNALYDVELRQFGFLDLTGQGITNLAGLEYCRSRLWVLVANQNLISDLSPLAGLTNLGTLHLYQNRVQSLAGLGMQRRLTALHLGNNQIGDLSLLSTLTNVNWLMLHDNQVSSLAGLETLASLNVLNLWNNQVSSLSAITNLHLLSNLNVGMNLLTSLEGLAGLTNLHDLVVSGNPLSPEAVTNQIPVLRQRGVNVIWP